VGVEYTPKYKLLNMGKKGKSKDRLDKYYLMAKEHNYRSRAAFKLIQLNRKYDFLTKAKCLVDLCAAPGGWLQVASKYMPISSIKVGIDLDPIKPVKGCLTFVADITTPKCISIIKREIKHFQVDVVLNDGAPNVGAQWNKDAFGQSELVLAALKVATQILKKGGIFVTKVFRSKDYNSLIWVLNFFFEKVEVSKPAASRSSSAEIFIVCLNYKKPDTIDPKFLDPKHVFEDIKDEEEDSSKKINSLKKLLDVKKNRSGYDVDGSGAFYKEANFSEFMESRDPYRYLSTCHKLVLDEKCKTHIFKTVTPPNQLKNIVEDLKVLGRSDLTIMLKYRSKYQRRLEKEKAKLKRQQEEENKKELTPEELEKQNEEELNKEIAEKKKQAMKKERKQKEIQKKSEYIQKMSVMTSINVNNNVSLFIEFF
jgi:AdoMet-dependent rRNA methyltransferase SPB1